MWKPVFILAALGAAALADEKDAADWKPLDAKPAAHRQLLDCRSPVIVHERRVKLGEAFKLDDGTLIFGLDGQRITVTHQTPGKDAGAPQVIGESPAAYVFEAFKGQYGLSIRLSTDRKHVHIASLLAIEVPLGSASAFLVDSDLDGDIGGKGDGVVVPESKTVGPVQPRTQLWSRSAAAEVKCDEKGAWLIAALTDPKPVDRDHSATWRMLQWQRQAAGVLPLKYDAAIEKGMGLHIDYLIRNSRYSHYEYPQHPGYTAEGAQAGMTSVIGNLKKSYADGMQSQLTTMFHRGSVLAPELEASAMLLKRELFMCSTKLHVKGPLWGKPLVYPAHGTVDVPCEFNIAGETPNPFEGAAANNKRGTAISVRYAQLYYTAALPSAPTLTLESVDEDGKTKAVDADLYHPGKPPRSDGVIASNLGHVALIPRRFLQPRTRHRAAISMPVPVAQIAGMARHETFTYEWEFTTGESQR